MSKLITDAQKHEIEELAVEHSGALIAYGADLYRKGMIKGLTIGIVGFYIGRAIGDGVELLIQRKR